MGGCLCEEMSEYVCVYTVLMLQFDSLSDLCAGIWKAMVTALHSSPSSVQVCVTQCL